MKTPKDIDVLFVAGFGPIVRDPGPSRKFYSEVLGLPLQADSNGYLHTGGLDGVKHFAQWPLAQAAESCFGTDQWPDDVPAPQAWIEFDVGDIEKATGELKSQGYKLLVARERNPGARWLLGCWDRKACWWESPIRPRFGSDVEVNFFPGSGNVPVRIGTIGTYANDQSEEADSGGAGAAVCACGRVRRPGGGCVCVGRGGACGRRDNGGADRDCDEFPSTARSLGGRPVGAGRARRDDAGRG